MAAKRSKIREVDVPYVILFQTGNSTSQFFK